MKKMISTFFLLLIASGLAACSGVPSKYSNSPEQQHRNAKEAQDELSKDVSK